MKINVEGLAQGSRVIEYQLSPKEFEPDAADLALLGTVNVVANVSRMGEDVFIQCDISASLSQSCCRCLEDYESGIQTTSQTLYVPEKPPDPSRHEIRRPIRSDEDDNVVRYRGKVINLSGEILNSIRLTLPMKPLCASSCLGLCLHCGANLNQKRCECGSAAPDSRNNPFLALKDRFSDSS